MNGIQQGLLISAIGMGLVFGVIVFLWGLMALMMRLTSREKSIVEEHPPTLSSTKSPLNEGRIVEKQRRVIAVATAVKLAIDAEKAKETRLDTDKFEQLSPWQAVHRTRQIEQKRINS